MQILSIIIPVFNEEDKVLHTIEHLRRQAVSLLHEVIVVDGGSTDNTVSYLKAKNITCLVSRKKGRAAQMNLGAAHAKNQLIYFLHADSLVPAHFDQHIADAHDAGAMSGCFRLQFDHDHWFLKLNSWFTRFDVNAIRFGDQSLFVTRDIFEKSGGFKENLIMMEDQEIIHRLKKWGKFSVMNEKIITSSRKYLDNGVYRMQYIFFRIWLMYYLGYSQQEMLHYHRQQVKKHKL